MKAGPLAVSIGLASILLVGFLLSLDAVAIPWVVAGPSMEPTLRAGDRLLIDRWSYRHRSPRHGELVLLLGPQGLPLVKRVAAPPPESPVFPALWQPEPATGSNWIWVVGDNPATSRDSRDFGLVPGERIRGRVVLRYWPPERAGTLGLEPIILLHSIPTR